MTEKQKMLAGLPYHSRDPELIAMYHRARALMQAYNQLDSRDLEQRKFLLEQLLGRAGKNTWIEAPFFCDYGENIFIGDDSFINCNCIFIDNNRITIGKNALIAPQVQIYTATHPLKAEERIQSSAHGSAYLTQTQAVSIGDDVWIGGNTIIFPGVSIGNKVTIGAGSVVTNSIPDGVLAYGNPCRVVREL
ncbi:MAG TPA: sugar O-acetyltransferase [Saprospiraceae bacterium]|nr:sugar O-acetyltransferase [Saprospiraceae bacterium]HMQ84496.1 sugar O-acetyltransferase [Saprospiraceae bacterium]